MKAKKVLSLILAVAMIFGTMSISAFADTANATALATVDGTEYSSLDAAVDAANTLAASTGNNVVVQLGEGTYEIGGVNFPAVVDNITIKGAANYGTILKDSSLNSATGSAISYTNIVIDGIKFENSYILFTGSRTDAKYADWTIKNCVFTDITAVQAAVAFSIHNTGENFKNFTFTNNVIDGVYGYPKSGLYISKPSGNIVISENSITNVNWNAIQCINPVGDYNITITNNTLASSADEGVLNLFGVPTATLTGNTIETLDGQPAYAHFAPAASVDGVFYPTLQKALNNAVDNSVVLVYGTINEGSVMLPASITGLTIDGQGSAVLDNTRITASDGNSVYYKDLTIKGLTFNGGNIVITGQRNSEYFENLTFTNNIFNNVNTSDGTGAIHLNMKADSPVCGLNVFGNKFNGINNSAIYTAALDGNVIVEENTFTNIGFRPFILQVTNNNGTEDTVNVDGNTFNTSAKGRLQIVGKNSSGTDDVYININNNIVYEVTEEWEFCIYNLSQEKTTTNFSGNYWEAGVADNYSSFYYNGQLSSNKDLVDLGFFPSFTELNADGTIATDSIVTGEEFAEAKIGSKLYSSLADAIKVAQDGDTITILPGTHDAFTVPEGKNNLTFVGATDAEGNNLVTIRTLEDDIATQTKGIYVQAEKATFKNLDIVSGSSLVKWLCSALGATNNGVGLGHSNLNELIVEDCNFKGNGSKYAIWTRACDVDITNCTFDGYLIPVESYNLGETKAQEINITNVEITNASNAFHTVNTNAGAVIKVKDSVISADMIHISAVEQNGGDFIIENSVLKDVHVEIMKDINFSITDSAVYASTFHKHGNSTGTMTLSEIYVENVNEVAYNAKKQGIVFDSYYATMDDFAAKANLKDVPVISDAVYVEFEHVTKPTAEGEKVYNINLKAELSQTINRLNSADLEFVLTTENGAIEYNVLASNDEVTINEVADGRYEFHYAGKDDADSDTANVITIGQVKFTGVGKFDFGVKVNETNVVHATTIGDNIVDTYLPNDDTTFVAEGELVIDDNTISDVVIEVPTRELEVQIDFNNAADKNVIDYQDMTVVVSGGDLKEDIEIKLGDTTYTTDVEIFGKSKAKYTVSAAADNKYIVTVSGALASETTYTVTVKGAGYRTVRKNITMNEDVTADNILTYWNNVKDADGADFLAGDIVKDNTINVYDLSAVVSYFGRTNDTSAYSKYAKYDLNRDGKIDSKDVAYVLVSWGK